jgi:hypothetical protein
MIRRYALWRVGGGLQHLHLPEVACLLGAVAAYFFRTTIEETLVARGLMLS